MNFLKKDLKSLERREKNSNRKEKINPLFKHS